MLIKTESRRRRWTGLGKPSIFVFLEERRRHLIQSAPNDVWQLCVRCGLPPEARSEADRFREVVRVSSRLLHPGHCSPVLAMAVSSDNKLLATVDMDRLIIIWDTLTMTWIHTFKGHRDAVSGLVFRRGTHTLYSYSHDCSVKIWECDKKAYVETLYGHQDAICGIDSGVLEPCVTVGGQDGSARVWKIVEESQLVYNGPQSSLDCVKLLNEEH